MSFTVNNNGSKFLLWSLLVVVLDQLTKYLIVSTIPVNSIGYRVAPFFDIIHVHNEGAAFSFLASSGGWQRYFFMLIAVAISIALFIALLRTSKEKKWTCLAISLVIGGAIGNLIDRVCFSFVLHQDRLILLLFPSIQCSRYRCLLCSRFTHYHRFLW